jgi:hypothetical protein
MMSNPYFLQLLPDGSIDRINETVIEEDLDDGTKLVIHEISIENGNDFKTLEFAEIDQKKNSDTTTSQSV